MYDPEDNVVAASHFGGMVVTALSIPCTSQGSMSPSHNSIVSHTPILVIVGFPLRLFCCPRCAFRLTNIGYLFSFFNSFALSSISRAESVTPAKVVLNHVDVEKVVHVMRGPTQSSSTKETFLFVHIS